MSAILEAARPVTGGLPRTIDVLAVLDRPRLGAFRRRTLLICWLIAVLDGYDVQSMAFVASTISQAWDMPLTRMGQVLTASLVGLMLGSVLFGRLSDRVGRRPMLLGAVVVFGAGSLLTALSENALQLMLMRAVTGMGLGGGVVAALALTVEYAPQRSRTMLVTAMFVGFPLGGSIGGMLATPLLTELGWQSVFVIGGLAPLLLLAIVWRRLPESLPYLVTSGAEAARVGALLERVDPSHRHAAGDRYVLGEQRDAEGRTAHGAPAGTRMLFTPQRLPGTLLIWTVCFANLLVLYLLINWLPSILQGAGFSLSLSNTGAVLFNLGGVFGGLALSVAVDRLGARRVLAVAYAVTAIVVLLLARAQSVTVAFALAALAGAGIIGSQFCFNALIAVFYPTAVRSTGVGWALGVGRIGSILGPLLGGFVLASGATLSTIFSGTAIPLLVCSAAVGLLAVLYRSRS